MEREGGRSTEGVEEEEEEDRGRDRRRRKKGRGTKALGGGCVSSSAPALTITVDNRFNLRGMIDNLSVPVMLSLHNTLLLISDQDGGKNARR